MVKPNREKQTEVLRRTQAERKRKKREQVLAAIDAIQVQKQPLTFPNVAKVAGCSVSYIYKYDDLVDYIHTLQDKEQNQLSQLEEKPPTRHSLKTLHEVFKQRIRQLEAEIKELKRQNQKLRGHVAEIFELRDECERLRNQLRELTASQSSTNVVPLQGKPKSTPKHKTSDVSPEIVEAIEAMGIKVGVRLQREINRHDFQKVQLAIQAFEQYRSQIVIQSPGACLLAMIRDEAEPNQLQNLSTPEQDEFDRWYREAVRTEFCLDIPKNLLGIQSGEIVVKVKDNQVPSRYIPMKWRVARNLMKECQELT